jgi:glycosyltransferase involved in cell wall biosynthesis
MLALIDRQVKRLPCFRLALGSDVESVPAAIAALLADATRLRPKPVARPAARPLVSVVVPVYNGLQFLPAAIESVLAQRYPALEIIVVDDGVGPAIQPVVAALPVEVRLLPKRNGGAADARNTGLRAASGELIAFLDVDDLWAPGKLTAAVEWLAAHPDCDVVTGGAQLFRQPTPDAPIGFVGSPADTYRYYIGAALFRRRAFERVGPFDTGLRQGEDTDWFARAAEAGLLVEHLAATVLLVRRHAENTTAAQTVPQRIPLQLARNALIRKRAG